MRESDIFFVEIKPFSNERNHISPSVKTYGFATSLVRGRQGTLTKGEEKLMQNEEIKSRQRLDKPEGVYAIRRAVRFIHYAQFFKP